MSELQSRLSRWRNELADLAADARAGLSEAQALVRLTSIKQEIETYTMRHLAALIERVR